MKLVYITASSPWGSIEPFLLDEMLEMKDLGIDLLVIPRNPSKEIFNKNADNLQNLSIWLPLINSQMAIVCLKASLSRSIFWKILFSIIKNSRNIKIAIKNLAVFPKGIFVAELIKNKNIKHIHAHWGSTTSTMAFIISQIGKIPWSFTLHRWDIKENNLLEEKLNSASFVRCISEHGKSELLNILGNKYLGKIHVIHMGVKIPEETRKFQENNELFLIIIPANLLPVKGHRYLIEALSILINRGISNFKCHFYGQGPLKERLAIHIKNNNVDNFIEMLGTPISHEQLMNIFKNQNVGSVILPSINTDDGEHEGIPVALMEAMAYQIPVISTETGGIPELIGDGSGIMIREKDPESIANAIEKLMKNPSEYKLLAQKGMEKVKKDFNITSISTILLKMFN